MKAKQDMEKLTYEIRRETNLTTKITFYKNQIRALAKKKGSKDINFWRNSLKF